MCSPIYMDRRFIILFLSDIREIQSQEKIRIKRRTVVSSNGQYCIDGAQQLDLAVLLLAKAKPISILALQRPQLSSANSWLLQILVPSSYLGT